MADISVGVIRLQLTSRDAMLCAEDVHVHLQQIHN